MILPHICNMQVLIISCSSSLFGSIFSRIFSMREIWTCMKKSQSFPMPYSVNVTFDKDLSVLSKTLGGVLMLLLIKGTLFDKKTELNNSAFCLKSLINLFSWKSDIFLLFRKDLRQLAGLQFLRFYDSKKFFFPNKVIDKTRTT